MRCVIDHYEVCCTPVALRMQRKRWLSHRMKELIQIFNRPWPITGLLTGDGALPSGWLWSINKDSNINVLAWKRMQGMQAFHHHHIGRLHVLLANASMLCKRPQGDVGARATAQCCQVLCQSFKVRGFREVTQVLRRCLVVGQIVVGADHALGKSACQC